MNLHLILLFFLSNLNNNFANASLLNQANRSFNERITRFDSTITVHEDASLTVKEVISVVSAGKQIRRGIVRIFPTRYKDNKTVQFKVAKILRDGQPAKYDISHKRDFTYVYIREKNKLLTPGKYTFEITYKTNRQLGFFENYDELAWNVTGAFTLPIDKVVAKIILPREIPRDKIQLVAYTGYSGERGKDYKAQILGNGNCQFETTRPFKSGENITIVAIWPKGYIQPPTTQQNIKYAILAHLNLFMAIIGLLILFIFFITVKLIHWKKDSSVIIPRFKTPTGIFPGKIRFLISKTTYDKTAFAADIVNMAVLGLLKIEPIEKRWRKKYYRLIKDNPKTIPQEYKKAYTALFSTDNTVILKYKNMTTIKNAWLKMDGEAKDKSEQYINPQKCWVYIGTILGIILLLLTLALSLYIEGRINSSTTFQLLALVLLPHFIFGKFLKIYTPEGKTVIDDIQGFKMFLNATETDRLSMTSAPERTPQQYERFLPYAIALGVEKNWTKQFAPIFAKLLSEGKMPHPIWYLGNGFHSSGLSSSLGSSLSSSLISSTHAPGTTSSFGGGGSSGSGGGGGGGGGC